MKKIYFGGNILTMADSRGGRVQALLIDDGRVRAAGDLADIETLAGGDAQRMDLQGSTLMPGFVDGHSHICQYADTLRCVDVSGARTGQAIADAMREALRERAQTALRSGDMSGLDAWLAGFGYDQNLLPGREHPDKHLLDGIGAQVADEFAALPMDARRALAATPMLITHASGHMGVLNSAGLERAHIGADTEIAGGMIAHDAQGQPTGYMEEAAFMRAAGGMGAPTDAERMALLERAQREYLKRGVTTAQEGLASHEGVRLLKRASAAGRLKLDVVCYADLRAAVPPEEIVEFMRKGDMSRGDIFTEEPELASGYQGGVRLGGYKLFLDGSPQGRTAWLRAPYLPGEGQGADYCGYPVYSEEQAQAYVLYAAKRGRQLLTHCNGDAAIDQLLRAQQLACLDTDARRNRNVIIHAQLMQPDQLPRAAHLGMIPSYFAAHVRYWGDAHLRNFGMERASGISPLGLAERLDMPFTVHQDTPVLPPDMLETMQIALDRRTAAGELLAKPGITDVSRAAIMRAETVYGAYEYFEEEQKGRLLPGMRADMVRLSADPMTAPVEEIAGIKVLETYKDGNVVYSA